MDPLFRLRIASTQIWNNDWGMCLAPRLKCENRPIRAHSVQNAGVLERLARDGHVFTLGARIHPRTAPRPKFQWTGRNNATTFEGFCAEHDRAIFRRIDTEPLEVTDREQMFLLAYRAATRELHTTMAVAAKIQASYEKSIELGLSDGDSPSDQGMFAVHRMVVAWDTHRYRLPLDPALIERRFNRVEHRIVEIPCRRSTIAVSSLFSVDSVQSGDTHLMLSLSVLPLADEQSVAIFSWRDCDRTTATSWLNEELPPDLDATRLRRRVSRIVLANCENVVLAPSFVDGLSASDKDQILKFFLETALHPDSACDLDVDLFD
jgi:hypothetical protein